MQTRLFSDQIKTRNELPHS